MGRRRTQREPQRGGREGVSTLLLSVVFVAARAPVGAAARPHTYIIYYTLHPFYNEQRILVVSLIKYTSMVVDQGTLWHY
jgi:hypothetical protein